MTCRCATPICAWPAICRPLEFGNMSGRVRVGLDGKGFVDGKQVKLATRPPIQRPGEPQSRPMDFSVDWQMLGRRAALVPATRAPARASMWVRWRGWPGTCRSTRGTRLLLEKYAPHGRVSMATAKWTGGADGCRPTVQGRFRQMALKRAGLLPVSPACPVRSRRRSGGASARSRASRRSLPGVFPFPIDLEPPIR